jgi:methionyl-tRNA synthetase
VASMKGGDQCVMCGAYVPEGRQVCRICELAVEMKMYDTVLARLDEAEQKIKQARSMLALLRRDA